MQVTRKSRLHLRAQNIIFVFLLLVAAGLVAWLSTHYTWQADWSAGNRNSLSDASRELLNTLDAPIAITAFARETPALRQQISNLVQRYQRSYEQVSLTFINPDTHPAQARELDITLDGELIVHYAGKSEHVRQLNEAAITNALQRLARENNSRILFVTGHGERLPPGNARNNQGSRNFDLGSFGQKLIETGFTLGTINLAKVGAIPDNTSFIVIAGPQTDYLPAEVQTLQTYLANGGNLLWLAEPGSDRHGLAPLADTLGIQFLPGLVIDATSKLFGVSDPSMILVPRYPDTPLTHDFNLLTVYPQATGLAITNEETPSQKASWES
ncbi:MAG TPA: GldG family protein, partial [Gammaproteobacteria bacterium]|nr:GldG family protein [Gammaproteobacteria bacterium]